MSSLRYSKYRESGVHWLGEVPDHWGVAPLKRGFQVRLGKMLQTDKSNEDDVLLPYLRAANIHWKGVELDDVKLMWFSSRDREQLRLNSGDLLVSEGGDVGRSAIWRDTSFECYIQNSVNRIRAKKGNSTEFLYYWMSTIKDKGYVDVLCNKSTIAHFTAEKVAEVPVPFPLLSEQLAIATFLDRETAKIDALISEQEKLIKLLAEKRQATISHAVTKGLNPHAPMKDSGVEWLGEVPEHWVVLTFQRCVYVAEGQVNPEDELYRSMILIAPNHVESKTGRLIALETAEGQSAESGKYLCEAGDVIYSKIRPALRKVCIAPELCLCSADMYPLRGNSELTNEFLFWFILSEQFSAWAVLESDRVAMPKINRESLKSVWLACPPVDEQECISDFLSNETVRLDNLADEAGRGIALLKERRSALISAAVTGKIDVRQAVQQEQITIQDAA